MNLRFLSRNAVRRGSKIWDETGIEGLPLYDEVRSRAFEDGLSTQALDRELQAGKYFPEQPRKTKPEKPTRSDWDDP